MKQILSRLFSFICLITLLFAATLVPPAATAAASDETISGTVLEAMNAAGYTYLQIETASGPVWAAIPETPIAVGTELVIANGMEMKDFHSKTFDRTFASIIFSPGLVGGEPSVVAPQEVAGQPAATADNSFAAAVAAEKKATLPEQQPQQGSAGSMGAIVPFSEVKVSKAEGENAFTIAELFDQGKELDGRTVRVRGQVVKYNANIMGKNWIHLQDGSGDPMQNTHDLVITTTEEVASPQVVTIEGTLAADKDFGFGYKYEIIVENGSITK